MRRIFLGSRSRRKSSSKSLTEPPSARKSSYRPSNSTYSRREHSSEPFSNGILIDGFRPILSKSSVSGPISHAFQPGKFRFRLVPMPRNISVMSSCFRRWLYGGFITRHPSSGLSVHSDMGLHSISTMSSTWAFLMLRRAMATASGSMSPPRILQLKGRSALSSLYRSSNSSSSKSGHFSKAKLVRYIPGLMLAAIRAASIRNVPEPHIGSAKSVSPRHPVVMMMPAARTSLIGASVCSSRYPRLLSGSPLESSEMVTRSPSMWTLNSRS